MHMLHISFKEFAQLDDYIPEDQTLISSAYEDGQLSLSADFMRILNPVPVISGVLLVVELQCM
jgi:hypothetical protein